MPMINSFTNQFIAMEPKSAKSLIGSLTLKNRGSISVIDQNGLLDAQDKPRIVQAAFARFASSGNVGSKPYTFVDGIAVIPVNGSLLHGHGYIGSYYSGYEAIVSLFDSANADPDVKGILFIVNSPGGTVAGCFDACDHIYESKGAKPVWSLYDDMACSGAMCIGSAADRRLTTQTAISGSIGVIQIHVSYEGMINESGMEITLIYSGAHKVDGNPYKNLPDDVYEQFKAECNTLKMQFAEKVARNIGIDIQQVIDTEARTYTGQEAINAGLADELINSHHIISHFKEYLSTPDGSNQRSVTMSDPSKNAGAESVTTTEIVTPNAAANTEQAAVVVDQKQRCAAIIGAPEAQGRTDLAHHLAFKTDLDADAALAVLAASPEKDTSFDKGNNLDLAMASIEQPNIGAMSQDSEQSEASQFVASYNKVTGEK
jgi:signal peptide peptidase SppA